MQFRQYYTDPETGKKRYNLITVGELGHGASDQTIRYCRALREGGIRPPLAKNIRLFKVVMVGVGTHVVAYRPREFEPI